MDNLTHRILGLSFAVCLALGVAMPGCAKDDSNAQQNTEPPSQQSSGEETGATASESQSETVETEDSAETEASDEESATPVTPPTNAEEVVDVFVAAGLPCEDFVVFDSGNDPSGLLGQEGYYSSKASFMDSRYDTQGRIEFDWTDVNKDFGGTIEFFDNEDDCKAREAEVEDAIASFGFAGAMSAYRCGTVYLRIGPEVEADVAEEYAIALSSSLGDSEIIRTGLASESFPKLEKTGSTTQFSGVTFSIGEGWTIGQPLYQDFGEQVYYILGSNMNSMLAVSAVPLGDYSYEDVNYMVDGLIQPDAANLSYSSIEASGHLVPMVTYDTSDSEHWTVVVIPLEYRMVVIQYITLEPYAVPEPDSFVETIGITEESLSTMWYSL